MTGFNVRNFTSNMKLEDEEKEKKRCSYNFRGQGSLGVFVYVWPLHGYKEAFIQERNATVEKQNPSYVW